jgi:hypothetical protein
MNSFPERKSTVFRVGKNGLSERNNEMRKCTSFHTGAAWAVTTVVLAAASAQASNPSATQLTPKNNQYPSLSIREQSKSIAGMDVSKIGVRPMTVEQMMAGGQRTVAGGVGVTCSQVATPQNCQLPDQGGHGASGTVGATSDAEAGFSVVERFSIAAGGSITEVCWWGFYLDFTIPAGCGVAPPDDNFTINFYENDPSCPESIPAALLAGPYAVTVTRTATGNVIASGAGDLIEYEYTATIPATAVGATDCVWIEIFNDTSLTPDCLWLWSTAPGDGVSYQFNAAPPENDFDLAYCLNLELGDTSGCAGSVFPGCPGLGDCGEANGSAACDDACCCTMVCEIDGFCCDTDWDQSCANQALAIGCATFPLCAGEDDSTCQLHSTFNAFNSTVGTFEAADDFTTPPGDQSLSTLCWHGAYLPGDVADSFVVRVLEDVDLDGFPDTLVGEAIQGASLILDAKDATGQVIDGTTAAIFQYSATLTPAIDLAGDSCYWLQITNDIGGLATDWFWEWAEQGPNQLEQDRPARQGNARLLIDGPGTCVGGDNDGDDCGDIDMDTDCPLGDCVAGGNGYGFPDTVVDNDMSFCVGFELIEPACGFETLHDTGPHQTVLFNGAGTHLGWSSGDLDVGPGVDDQRRTAQAFTLPALPVGTDAWSIEHMLVEGFEPATGELNEFLNFEIFHRSALDVAPTPADKADTDGDGDGDDDDTVTVGFGAPDATTERTGFIATGLTLQPGHYWLTMWASNASAGATPSNFAWFTNAPDGINNVCTELMPPPAPGFEGCTPSDPTGDPPGSPAMLRARLYPVPGFGAYTLDPAVLAVDDTGSDPTPDPNDLYNAAFMVRGQAVVFVTCVEDLDGDGAVAVTDLLALLAAWGTDPGGPPDFNGDNTVSVVDLLQLLAAWGPCP